MSLRSRTTLGSMAAVFVAIFVFGLALGWLAQRTAPNDQFNRVIGYAESVAALAATGDPAAVTFREGDFYVIDFDGTVLATNTALSDSVLLTQFTDEDSVGSIKIGTLTDGETQYRAARVDWESQATGQLGWAVGLERTELVTEQLGGIRAVAWIAAIFAALVAGAAAWFTSGRALRPLVAIIDAADAIDDTTTDRLPAAKRSDEIGSLTTSLNGMLDRLSGARADLQASISRQEQFVADASHELRSPMTTIRSNAEFLVSKSDADPDDIASAALDIVAESERMSILVDDLLTLARADEHHPLRFEPVDLTGMLASLAHELATSRRPIRLDVSEPISTSGDPAALERMIKILIDNAIRYGAGTITLGLERLGDTAQLSVTDEGTGFHPDHLSKVFDRFFRANPARSPRGTGLGLAIAKATAESHHGSIQAENTSVGGRILVSVPIVSPSSHPPPI